MKISRIIRSIVAVLVIVLVCMLLLVTVRHITLIKSNLSLHIKIICSVSYLFTILLYLEIKKRLYNKLKNNILIDLYGYLYLGVLVFISRFLMVQYFEKDLVISGTMYQIIFSTILTYINSIVIKKIMFNITKSDMISTICAITYIFMPIGLFASIIFLPYNLNLTFILLGIYILLNIIDNISELKSNKNNYFLLIISQVVLIIADIINGNSYIYWLTSILLFSLIIEYSDIINIKILNKLRDKFKDKILFINKIPHINISKKTMVLVINIFAILIGLIITEFKNVNNFLTFENAKLNLIGLVENTRYLYLTIFILIIVTDFVSIILERKQDIKCSIINMNLIIITILTIFYYKGEYFNIIFEGVLILKLMLSISNIYLNRDEKIKLLKDKN